MSRPEITQLLNDVANGDESAQNRLFELVYEEMKRLARAHVRRSGAGLTINPTTLVHETWIKLARGGTLGLEGSAHFYNVVALAMRQIIHDLIAHKQTDKRGAGMLRVELADSIEQPDKSLDDLIAVEGALQKLRACDAELNELVEWHYLVGLSLAEIAETRSVSERTLKRQLAIARVFLTDAMRGG